MIDLDNPNHGQPVDDISHVIPGPWMKDLSRPPIDRIQIAQGRLIRSIELYKQDIAASPTQDHAISSRLIISGDEVDNAVLGHGLADGSPGKTQSRFAEFDALSLL
jgi:hypothetical protein